MTKAMTFDEFVEFYGELTSRAASVIYDVPVEEKHTGPEPRAIANLIIELLENEGLIEVPEMVKHA